MGSAEGIYQGFVRVISAGKPARLLIPATAALLQLKVTPGVALAGVYENKVLLHTAGGVKVPDK